MQAALSLLSLDVVWYGPAVRAHPPCGSRSFESLESRELLSYTVTIDGSHLELVGTDGRECVYAIQERTSVNVREFCRGEKKTEVDIQGVFTSLNIDLRGGDDKLVIKGFSGSDIDIALGTGNDTVRYYDTIAEEFCVTTGSGDDTVKARRNKGGLYMLDGGPGHDSLTNWANNQWRESDITAVEQQGVFRNGRVH